MRSATTQEHLAGQARVLRLTAAGAPLEEVLDELLRSIEAQCPELRASILLARGNRLRHGAAPSLPDAYWREIDGVPIGPNAGCCGTAAYLHERIIASDISTDPRWQQYREAALAHGLRACWSIPILSAARQTLGTFAFYYPEARSPTVPELALGDEATSLAEVVISLHRAQRLLRRSEERYRVISELSSDLAFSFRVRGEASWPEWLTGSVERTTGYTQEELGRRESWERLIHPEDGELTADVGRRLRAGEAARFEFRIVARSGEVRWLHTHALPEMAPDGSVRRFYGAAQDITERKLAEQALTQAYEQERETAEQLRELDETKNTFLQAVAHELRTPVTNVIGFAEALHREELGVPPEMLREFQERLLANARKLGSLLSDLLDVERLSRGLVGPDRREVDIRALVRVTARSLRGEEHTLIEDPAGSLIVPVDPMFVERIVENLVGNSLRHTPAGTRIWVRVERDPSGPLLITEDDGPGVPDELKETVFEPFRRGRGKEAGTGVGLSLVARLAGMHGGRAWVQDRPGGGASFRVLLPDG